MAKTIVANKLLIFSNNGSQDIEAILQYKVSDEGVTSQGFKSVSVKGNLDQEMLSNLMTTAIDSAKQSEGIQ